MIDQITSKWDSRLYTEKHSFVFNYGASLVELLDPKNKERILDLGCGSGELTNAIQELSRDVIGMDRSPEMIEKAKAQFPWCKFQLGDATDFHFERPFNAIFSNAALHWVVPYKKAISCMYANLAKEGRIVVEFGGKNNVRAITDQLRRSLFKRGYVEQSKLQLWYFPSIAEYTSELEAQGFDVTFAQLLDRPTELADTETGVKDWLTMFGMPFFDGVEANRMEEIKSEVQESLRPELFKEGKWFADYKRIRVIAYK